MINLLSKNDKIKQKEDGTIDYADLLMRKLEEGKDKKELVYTQNMRNIGKTYTLVEFAKKYDYTVIVNDLRLACKLRKDYNYDNIESNEHTHVVNMRVLNKLVMIIRI